MSGADRHVVIDPLTDIKHGLRIYYKDAQDGRVTVMTICDFGELYLGKGALVRSVEQEGRYDCLRCLASETR